jgi:ribose transport system substrate-binding protein
MIKKYAFYIITGFLCAAAAAALMLVSNGNALIAEQKTDSPRIALVAHMKDNPYWQIIKKGAEAAAKERGVILEYYGPDAPNVAENLKLIDMNIAARVDGLITYVQEEDKYQPYIDKAIDKGIPVITIDTDAKSSKRIAYVGTDNFDAGRKAGKVLYEKVGSGANIGVIMGGLTTTNQVERLEGFKNYLAAKADVEIVTVESSNDNELSAKIATNKMIKENPDLNSLYCTSVLDGVGAAKAVVENKLQGRISIICFDDLPETLEYIKRGIIHATIVQKPYDMGYESVQRMMDKISGKEIKALDITDTVLVTQENVDYYIDTEKRLLSEQK